jgi:hypothetical protein
MAKDKNRAARIFEAIMYHIRIYAKVTEPGVSLPVNAGPIPAVHCQGRIGK